MDDGDRSYLMKNKLIDFFDGFYNGLTKASLGSLFVAFLSVLAIIFLITPNTIRHLPPEFLMRSPFDESVMVTQKALNLRWEPSPPLSVTLIGASTLREALVPEQDISHWLTDKLKTKITVNKITAPGMKPWEIAGLIDCIPSDYKGIIVICISLEYNPNVLRTEQGLTTRFGIPSLLFDAELRHAGVNPPYRTGIYFFDHFEYLATHSRYFIKSLVCGPVIPKVYKKDGKIITKQEVEFNNKLARKRVKNYLTYATENFASLSRIFKQLKRDGLSLVYLQPTRNLNLVKPAYQSIYNGDLIEKIDNDFEKFTKEMGVEYLNFNIEGLFGCRDFRDFNHLSNHPARMRFSKLLMVNLERIFQTRFGMIQ